MPPLYEDPRRHEERSVLRNLAEPPRLEDWVCHAHNYLNDNQLIIDTNDPVLIRALMNGEIKLPTLPQDRARRL